MPKYTSLQDISATDALERTRLQIGRQILHWTFASRHLAGFENLASPHAWNGLERYLGVAIRRSLQTATDRLQQQAVGLHNRWRHAQSAQELEVVRRQVVNFRSDYLRTETTLDFYADAVNARTNPQIAAILRACDVLARRSMEEILDPIGRSTPPVLTYLDKGLGASILKAGLRLWDGSTENPAAVIKVVRHNLYYPTSLIHEAGHQVAHIAGWNEELASTLETGLTGESSVAARVWAGWASEIAADAVAFVHTGYAAVAGLHNVLAGDEAFLFRYQEFDPHPISYIRVLLGIEMCRQFYGDGPWDELAWTWTRSYSLDRVQPAVQAFLRWSLTRLPRIVGLTLRTPMRAFRGRPLCSLIDPARVSPQALLQLEREAGPALYTSAHWVWEESLRILGLTGYRAATSSDHADEILQRQETWLLRLGESVGVA